MDLKEEEAKIDPVQLWREEISKELRDWLAKHDERDAIARLMTKLEKRSPQDLFDETDFDKSPGVMIHKLSKIGIRGVSPACFDFYKAFHKPTIEECMLFRFMLINLQLIVHNTIDPAIIGLSAVF